MGRFFLFLKKILLFYIDGFRSMRLGRGLWLIIIIKLLIIFGVFKLFFFEEFLESKFDNDIQRYYYIMDNLTQQKE